MLLVGRESDVERLRGASSHDFLQDDSNWCIESDGWKDGSWVKEFDFGEMSDLILGDEGAVHEIVEWVNFKRLYFHDYLAWVWDERQGDQHLVRRGEDGDRWNRVQWQQDVSSVSEFEKIVGRAQSSLRSRLG